MAENGIGTTEKKVMGPNLKWQCYKVKLLPELLKKTNDVFYLNIVSTIPGMI